jgi:hypothetical protein
MSKEKVLLLFDKNRPFWTKKLVALAGESPDELDILESLGLVAPRGDGFVLTEKGKEQFRRWAAESWLEEEPGEEPEDILLEERRLELALRFDLGFKGFKGHKQIFIRPKLSFFPNLPKDRIYSYTAGNFKWLFMNDPLIQNMQDLFPRDRKPKAEDLKTLEKWIAERKVSVGEFVPDLLCLNQCDYEYYWRDNVPTDRWGLLNKDRIFIRYLAQPESATIEDFAEDIAQYALFLLDNRLVYLPSCFDIDTQQQSTFTWWIWCVDTVSQAKELSRKLKPLANILAAPASPTDLWLLTMETLRAYDKKAESFYEFVDEVARCITR